jgi:hypothetical protein
MAHNCNPSYSGGRDLQNISVRPAQAKSEPLSKIPNIQKKHLPSKCEALSSKTRTLSHNPPPKKKKKKPKKTMSFEITTGGEGGGVCVTSLWWVETKETVKYPTMHKPASSLQLRESPGLKWQYCSG